MKNSRLKQLLLKLMESLHHLKKLSLPTTPKLSLLIRPMICKRVVRPMERRSPNNPNPSLPLNKKLRENKALKS